MSSISIHNLNNRITIDCDELWGGIERPPCGSQSGDAEVSIETGHSVAENYRIR